MSLRFQSSLQVDCLADEALDNSFEVIMPGINLDGSDTGGFLTTYVPIVEEITVPLRSFKNGTRRLRSDWINVADDIENLDEVSITLFCTSNMLAQYYLGAWKGLVFDNQYQCYNTMRKYKKDIHVYLYGSTSVGVSLLPICHLILRGCYPSRQDPLRLRYSKDPKRLTLTQRFRVDRVDADSSLATTAIWGELITNPTSALDNVAQSFLS